MIPVITYPYNLQVDYILLSTDPKPTNVAIHQIVFETDTEKTFQWNGAAWVEIGKGLVARLHIKDAGTGEWIPLKTDMAIPVSLSEPISVSFFDGRVAVTDFPDDTVWSNLIEALNDDVVADSGGLTTFGVNVVTWDGWSGKLVFEAAVNGIAYESCPVTNPVTGEVVTSAAGDGTFIFPCGGYMRLRVRVSEYTSGTALVTLRGSVAPHTGSIPLSNSQLRASAVPVSGPITAVEMKVSNFGQTLLEILNEIKKMNTHLSLITDEEV